LNVGGCFSGKCSVGWLLKVVEFDSVVGEDIRVDRDFNEEWLPPKLPVIAIVMNGPLWKGVCVEVILVNEICFMDTACCEFITSKWVQ
jgi:hypothetical protein